jgi:hypothetical protein
MRCETWDTSRNVGDHFIIDLFDDMKAELAKRPHVPNKIERKKIRQERAKRGV